MMSVNHIDQRRRHLKAQAACVFVDAHEFCALTLSRKQLCRADDKTAELWGVRDLVTGQWFVTEQEAINHLLEKRVDAGRHKATQLLRRPRPQRQPA